MKSLSADVGNHTHILSLSYINSFLCPDNTDNCHSSAIRTLFIFVKFNFVLLEHGRMYKAMLDSFALHVIFI